MNDKYTFLNDPDTLGRGKWLAFVDQHPQGNFFQSPEGFSFTSHFGEGVLLALLNAQNEIIGLITGYFEGFGPGKLQKIFRRIVVIGGPLVNGDDPLTMEILLNQFYREHKSAILNIEIRLLEVSMLKPTFDHLGYAYKPYLNITNNLDGTEEDIFRKFSSSRKKGIRKAEKSGFTVVSKDVLTKSELASFYHLIKAFHQEAKIPFPSYRFFESNNGHIPGQSILYYFLLDEAQNASAILQVLKYKQKMYGFILGYSPDPEFLKKRPFDFLYWEVFKHAQKNGFTTFDWMGGGDASKNYGVRDFKLQFGGLLIEPGRYNKVCKPILYFIFNKILVELYKRVSFFRLDH